MADFNGQQEIYGAQWHCHIFNIQNYSSNLSIILSILLYYNLLLLLLLLVLPLLPYCWVMQA